MKQAVYLISRFFQSASGLIFRKCTTKDLCYDRALNVVMVESLLCCGRGAGGARV